MKKLLLLTTLLLLFLNASLAQEESKTYQLQYIPEGCDNNNFAICYFNDKNIYNLRSMLYCNPGHVIKLKISPASFSFAVLYEKKDKREIGIFSSLNGKRFNLIKFKKDCMPTDFCYTPDARYMIVATENKELQLYETKEYRLVKTKKLEHLAENVTVSNNRYYLAYATGRGDVYVYNFEKGTLRAKLELHERINQIQFTSNNEQMGVLTRGGKLLLYETKNFEPTQTFLKLNDAKKCAFHEEEKYVSVISSTRQITILNRKDESDTLLLNTDYPGILHVGYATSLKGNNYLVFNTQQNLHFHQIDNLRPNYQKIVADSVNLIMNEWERRQKNETVEQYYQRVNEQSRLLMRRQTGYEISTKLAGNIIDDAQPKLGNYNMKDTILEIKIEIQPHTIYLKIAQNELAQFTDGTDLLLENSVFGIDDKDNFELMYTEVINKKTNKKYIYDNLSNKELHYEDDAEAFVPLEVIQQSSLDEMNLEAMKQKIIEQAIDSNLISDHTHINVKTSVDATTDADGKNILNYNIDFNYNVDEEFSAQDDYKPGRYICAESEAAMAMLRIVSQAFEEQFASYLKPGNKVLISVYGSADATPINRIIPYSSEYGDFNNELYYNNGQLGAITVTSQTGITTNEQLSFIRAAGVKNYVEQNIRKLQDMNVEYTYSISVSEERGAEHRRIGLKFTFIDVFGKKQ